MTRKDSEKDAERPHYYSQFWLDIAAGRRVIGGPRPEEAEAAEPEVSEPVSARKAGRGSVESYKVAPADSLAVEEENEPEEALDEIELPNIVVESEEEPELLNEEEEAFDEEPEEDEFFEEEEEEDTEEWDRRGGRKKTRPSRVVRPTTKPRRTNPRRNF